MESGAKKSGRPLLEKRHQRLIEENLELVNIIAHRIRHMLPPGVDLTEMIAAGREGLTQAALRFDPKQGTKFKTFAYYRIRGAIFDNIRRLANLSRTDYQHYQRLKFQEQADAYLEERAEEPPSNDFSQEVQALEDIASDTVAIFITSLDAAEDEENSFPVTPATPPAQEERLLDEELRALVRQVRKTLDPKEEEILHLIYDKELDMGQVAQKLGISRAWVSRLHGRAIQTLAKRLQNNFQRPRPGGP